MCGAEYCILAIIYESQLSDETPLKSYIQKSYLKSIKT